MPKSDAPEFGSNPTEAQKEQYSKELQQKAEQLSNDKKASKTSDPLQSMQEAKALSEQRLAEQSLLQQKQYEERLQKEALEKINDLPPAFESLFKPNAVENETPEKKKAREDLNKQLLDEQAKHMESLAATLAFNKSRPMTLEENIKQASESLKTFAEQEALKQQKVDVPYSVDKLRDHLKNKVDNLHNVSQPLKNNLIDKISKIEDVNQVEVMAVGRELDILIKFDKEVEATTQQLPEKLHNDLQLHVNKVQNLKELEGVSKNLRDLQKLDDLVHSVTENLESRKSPFNAAPGEKSHSIKSAYNNLSLEDRLTLIKRPALIHAQIQDEKNPNPIEKFVKELQHQRGSYHNTTTSFKEFKAGIDAIEPLNSSQKLPLNKVDSTSIRDLDKTVEGIIAGLKDNKSFLRTGTDKKIKAIQDAYFNLSNEEKIKLVKEPELLQVPVLGKKNPNNIEKFVQELQSKQTGFGEKAESFQNFKHRLKTLTKQNQEEQPKLDDYQSPKLT